MDRWVSAAEGAEHLGISRSSFYDYVRDGRLPEGSNRLGRMRWNTADLDSAMRGHDLGTLGTDVPASRRTSSDGAA